MPLFSREVFMGDRIPFWNRREIYVGPSLEDFNRIRGILDANKIKHAYRKTGMGGWNFQRAFMYYIYVHKKDEEAARFLIRK